MEQSKFYVTEQTNYKGEAALTCTLPSANTVFGFSMFSSFSTLAEVLH